MLNSQSDTFNNLNLKIFIDMDGTICGESYWTSFLHNTSMLFKTGLLIDIPNNVNWSILTSRPKLDRFWIKRMCKKYKLYPNEIITTNTWFYNFSEDETGKEDIASWKNSILVKELSKLKVDKVIYVDSDQDILSKMLPTPNIVLIKGELLPTIVKELTGNG